MKRTEEIAKFIDDMKVSYEFSATLALMTTFTDNTLINRVNEWLKQNLQKYVSAKEDTPHFENGIVVKGGCQVKY